MTPRMQADSEARHRAQPAIWSSESADDEWNDGGSTTTTTHARIMIALYVATILGAIVAWAGANYLP